MYIIAMDVFDTMLKADLVDSTVWSWFCTYWCKN